MAINIQADSTLPQGYLRIDGTTAATFSATSLTVPGSVSAPNTFGFKNRLINGDMRIDQRNNGASVSPANGVSTFPVDRFFLFNPNATSRVTGQQNAGSVTPPVGFTNHLGVTSTSAYSVTSSDEFSITQNIEGFNIADFGWGAANALPVTLSFWVRSSLTGTFGGSFRNSAANRSYPFSYAISSANTWEYKTITVAGDTTGTWVTNNGIGIRLAFSLGTGSTLSATAGAWASGNFTSATGATSVVGTNGATFFITGVQLERGSIATPFDVRPYGTELALCQRYAWAANVNMGFANTTNITGGGVLRTPVTMRTSPSIASGAIFQVSAGSAGTVGLLNATGYSTSPDGIVPYNVTGNWSVNVGVQFIGLLTAEL